TTDVVFSSIPPDPGYQRDIQIRNHEEECGKPFHGTSKMRKTFEIVITGHSSADGFSSCSSTVYLLSRSSIQVSFQTEIFERKAMRPIICAPTGAVSNRKKMMASAFTGTSESGNTMAAQIRNTPTPIVAALTVTDRRR